MEVARLHPPITQSHYVINFTRQNTITHIETSLLKFKFPTYIYIYKKKKPTTTTTTQMT